LSSSICIRLNIVLLVHQIVSLSDVLAEALNLNLLFLVKRVHIAIHDFIPCFCSSLSALVVALSCKFCRLLNGVDSKDLEICIFLQILLICGYLEVLGDNSHLSGAVQCSKVNLSLERHLGQLSEVNLRNLEELSERLHLIFEADVSVLVDISEILRKNGVVL